MRTVRQILTVLAILAVFSVAGCGGTDNVQTAKPAPAKAVGKAATTVSSAAGELLVSIIPDPATADGCLKALVSGLGTATYSWEVNGITVSAGSAATLCEGFRRGDTVRVSVSDGKATGSQLVTISNAPPRITEVTVNVNDLARHADLAVRATVVDVDGDPVEMRCQWHVNGEADPFLTDVVLPAGRYARGDSIRFTLVASDGQSESQLYQSETAVVPNAPPQILSQPPQRFEALEYRYQVKARDADGDPLVYSLAKAPQGMTVDRAGLVAWPLAGVQPGTYPLRVVVRDPEGAEAFQEFSLTLGAPPAGKP